MGHVLWLSSGWRSSPARCRARALAWDWEETRQHHHSSQRVGLGQIDVRIHRPISIAQLEVEVRPGRVAC